MWVADEAFISQVRTDATFVSQCAVQTGEQIKLLVLSDWHIKHLPNGAWNEIAIAATQRQVVERLTDLGLRRENKYDGVLIGGDIIDGRQHPGIDHEMCRVLSDIAVPCIQAVCGHLAVDPRSQLLLVPGNHDVWRSGAPIAASSCKTSRAAPFLEMVDRQFHNTGVSQCPALHDAPRLLLFKSPSGAHLAIIGLNSNQNEYLYPNSLEGKGLSGHVGAIQSERLQQLVEALTGAVRTAPLYIIIVLHHPPLAVEDGTFDKTHYFSPPIAVDGHGIVKFSQDHRVAMLVHGDQHIEKYQQIGYSDWRSLPRSHTPVVGCPPLLVSENVSRRFHGALEIRLQMYSGAALIEPIFRDTRDAMRRPRAAIRVGSSSRVQPDEHRLFGRVCSDLIHASRLSVCSPTVPPAPRTVSAREFLQYTKHFFDLHGYVAVCKPDSVLTLPPDAVGTHSTPYRLFVLLRRYQDSYFLLLNNHFAMEPSTYANWDTLLLPAIKSVREYLDRIKRDLERQTYAMSEEAAISTEGQRDKIAKLVESFSEGKADSMFREISSRKLVKYSATQGAALQYDYRLGVFEPFVLRSGTSVATDAMKRLLRQGEPVDNSHGSLIEALAGLPHVIRQGPRGPCDVQFDQISSSYGLRWDPAGRAAECNVRVPFGAIWFPMLSPDQLIADRTRNYWRECPSIVARNGDVMSWVDETLCDLISKNGGHYPDWLMLGSHTPAASPEPPPKRKWWFW